MTTNVRDLPSVCIPESEYKYLCRTSTQVSGLKVDLLEAQKETAEVQTKLDIMKAQYEAVEKQLWSLKNTLNPLQREFNNIFEAANVSRKKLDTMRVELNKAIKERNTAVEALKVAMSIHE
ncbi:MAG: hypothetical protein LWX54_03185 [Deltaproteobacteria bacterium]|jgi:chromosome segregation ATPase|nr:hypothetical protein [Deltaproteobacteria bacterium]